MSSSKIMANSLDDSVFDGVAREESVQSVLSAVSNNSISGIVKSTQRVTYTVPKGEASGTLALSEIDPTKSFVIWGRLYENADKHYSFNYSLSSTALTVNHANYTNAPGLVLDFWIIEFY